MTVVMEVVEQERIKSGLSAEQFANKIGLTSTTYSRQVNGRQALGFDSIQRYAQYARKTGNIELLKILGAYVLSLDPEQITINPS